MWCSWVVYVLWSVRCSLLWQLELAELVNTYISTFYPTGLRLRHRLNKRLQRHAYKNWPGMQITCLKSWTRSSPTLWFIACNDMHSTTDQERKSHSWQWSKARHPCLEEAKLLARLYDLANNLSAANQCIHLANHCNHYAGRILKHVKARNHDTERSKRSSQFALISQQLVPWQKVVDMTSSLIDGAWLIKLSCNLILGKQLESQAECGYIDGEIWEGIYWAKH